MWYKGILVSEMAGTADNNGAFDVLVSKMRRGTEPPPYVHSREDEFSTFSRARLHSTLGAAVVTIGVLDSNPESPTFPINELNDRA